MAVENSSSAETEARSSTANRSRPRRNEMRKQKHMAGEMKTFCVQEVARGCHKVSVTGQRFLSSSSKAEVFPNNSDGCSPSLCWVGSRAGRMLCGGREGNRGAAGAGFSSRTSSWGLGVSEHVHLKTARLLQVAQLLAAPFLSFQMSPILLDVLNSERF